MKIRTVVTPVFDANEFQTPALDIIDESLQDVPQLQPTGQIVNNWRQLTYPPNKYAEHIRLRQVGFGNFDPNQPNGFVVTPRYETVMSLAPLEAINDFAALHDLLVSLYGAIKSRVSETPFFEPPTAVEIRAGRCDRKSWGYRGHYERTRERYDPPQIHFNEGVGMLRLSHQAVMGAGVSLPFPNRSLATKLEAFHRIALYPSAELADQAEPYTFSVPLGKIPRHIANSLAFSNDQRNKFWSAVGQIDSSRP
jgi:hypothetical protein